MRRALLLVPVTIPGVLAPSAAFAQSRLGSIIPQEGICTCPGSAPDWGCILQIVQNAVNIAIALGVIVIVLALMYAGFVFMTAGPNPSRRIKGRNVLLNSLLGLAIMLIAWIGVDFVMKAVYNPSATFSGQNLGPWNAILASSGADMCIQVREVVDPVTGGTVTVVYRPLGSSGGSGGSSGGGSCTVPPNQNNPCHPSRLTCFGSRATDASKICMVESGGGNTNAASGSDKLNSGRGPSYSWGLWQINLTVHQVGGLNCPSAFTCQCAGRNLQGRLGHCVCGVKPDAASQSLYQRCASAALDLNNNTQVACRLYSQSGANGGFQPWRHTALNVCRVPLR